MLVFTNFFEKTILNMESCRLFAYYMPMENIVNYLTDEHRACDSLYAHLEEAIVDRNEEETKTYCNNFINSMETHLKKEEDILFPAFENATGNQMGPTQVMRMEHTQIRELLRQIREKVTENNTKQVTGILETLMILLQQHNMKEEQMLYPMADKALSANASELLDLMKKL